MGRCSESGKRGFRVFHNLFGETRSHEPNLVRSEMAANHAAAAYPDAKSPPPPAKVIVGHWPIEVALRSQPASDRDEELVFVPVGACLTEFGKARILRIELEGRNVKSPIEGTVSIVGSVRIGAIGHHRVDVKLAGLPFRYQVLATRHRDPQVRVLGRRRLSALQLWPDILDQPGPTSTRSRNGPGMIPKA